MPVLPPGPRFGLLEILRYTRDPSESTARMRALYGDAWSVRTRGGVLVMTSTPEHARSIFSAEPSGLDIFDPAGLGNIFGPRSLLASAGEPHRKDRKLLGPPFQGARMRAYGEVMREATRARISGLRRGDEIVAHRLTSQIAMDVILRAVFGFEPGHVSERAARVMEDALAALDPSIVFFRWLQHPRYPPYARYRAAMARFSELVRARIEKRRAGAPGEDILGLMMAARYDDGSPMSDEQIHDQLFTLLAAGHETTAIALAWALYELARHPGVCARAREEIEALGPEPAPEALAKLPYLGAIADETMRAHTIVSNVTRGLRAPLELGAYTIPAGAGVGVAIVGLHEDPAIYPEPQRFRPERFLERRFSPFEFVPFGGGSRRCLGAAFSDFELRVVLATLLAELEFTLVDPRPERAVRRNVTMGPERGVPLRVRPRRAPRGPAALTAA